ncbi:hypothetical protein [Kordiimonas aquimaris]|uniref:hypothetical protein n=1 Tax=Kordiimonas aquimaris TaxID=707591 RepID=UPI0021D2BE05|nr:hypothetical protein [Kordiimonas aquimaris]
MKHDILLIGTYHKTGTVWLQRVFMDAAQRMGHSFIENQREVAKGELRSGFYQDHHCRFSKDLLAADYVGFRMIRDPRDVVISGAHYHMKSDEAWLHEPLGALSGQSYAQAINAQPDMQSRYIFEAQQVANATTRDMIADVSRLPGMITVRYEDWIADETMQYFGAVMQQLGLTDEECSHAKEAFHRWSLFGRGNKVDAHARSGATAQWRSIFTRAVGEAFLAVHGDALVTLGYEDNHDWVLHLPENIND